MQLIPYARPYWDVDEIEAVTRVIRSGTWTNGPVVRELESALRDLVGARDLLAVANGTLALHAFLHLLRRGHQGRALYVTSSLNFTAGASAARLLGYDVALTDIDGDTLNMDPASLDEVLGAAGAYELIAVNPVHFAGVLADMASIARVARARGALLFEDACHAVGAPVAAHPDSLGAVFSFHPTKNVAAGEGGAIACNDARLAAELRLFCNHAMARADFEATDQAFDANGAANPWYYEVREPGTNFRLSELHAAVALCQVRRLDRGRAVRRAIAARYRDAFAGVAAIRLHPADDRVASELHLFPVELDLDRLRRTKAEVFGFLRERGVAAQVHYTPLHRMPAFARLPHVQRASFPRVDAVAAGLLSLPMFAGLGGDDQSRVIAAALALCEVEG